MAFFRSKISLKEEEELALLKLGFLTFNRKKFFSLDFAAAKKLQLEGGNFAVEQNLLKQIKENSKEGVIKLNYFQHTTFQNLLMPSRIETDSSYNIRSDPENFRYGNKLIEFDLTSYQFADQALANIASIKYLKSNRVIDENNTIIFMIEWKNDVNEVHVHNEIDYFIVPYDEMKQNLIDEISKIIPAVNITEKIEKDPREYLVIGCGKEQNCSIPHPPEKFITLDINRKMNPDFVMDMTALVTTKPFSAVIFESVPFGGIDGYIPFLFKKNLKEQGHVMIICSIAHFLETIFENNKNFGAHNQICWISSPIVNRQVMIIPKNTNVDLVLDSAQEKYLFPILKDAKLIKVTLNQEFVDRFQFLKRVLSKKLGGNFFTSLALMVVLNKSGASWPTLTAQHVKNILMEFTHTFFQNIPNEIKPLVEYLNQFKDQAHVLDIEELINILKKIAEYKRQITIDVTPGSIKDILCRVAIEVLHSIENHCYRVEQDKRNQQVIDNLKNEFSNRHVK